MAKSVVLAQLEKEIMKSVDKQLAASKIKVAQEVRAEWVRVARATIRKDVGTYINNIVDESGDGKVRISLRGKRANAVEYGTRPYDVKNYLIGPNNFARNYNHKGKYADIPFLKTNQAATEILGHNIRARALQPMKASSRKLMSGKIQRLGSRKTLIQSAQEKGLSNAAIQRIKASGLAGLSKEQQRFRTKQGKLRYKTRYVHFVRASRASGPWMRSPVPGAHVARTLRPRIRRIVKKVIEGGGNI